MNDTPDNQIRIEQQFIGLLLQDIQLVKKWDQGQLTSDKFSPEHYIILASIKKYLNEDCLLTRQAFTDECKGLIPVERIKQEIIFNKCYCYSRNKNQYAILEKQISEEYQRLKTVDALKLFASKINSSTIEEKAGAADKLSYTLALLCEGGNFRNDFSEYLIFPLEAIPKVLHPLIEKGAQSIICPQDYLAIPLLTALAGSIGRTYELEIKPGWRESSVLWTVAVGRPGSSKSPALQAAIKGVYSCQNIYMIDYETEIKQYEKDCKIYKRDIRKWERNGCDEPPEEPEKPNRKRNIVSDTTVEALAPIMLDNPRGIMLIRDELAGWITSMNQYKSGKGGDIQFFLECWSCGQFTIDRKSLDNPILIPHTYLTVCGTCQPETLRNLLNQSRQEDGFAARLLPYYPEEVEGYWCNEGIDPEIYNPINKLYKTFTDFTMDKDEYGIKKPKLLSFTKCGKIEFINVLKRQQEIKLKYKIKGILESVWAKQKGYIARLALVIHLIRYHAEETKNINVDKQSVSMAERLSLYFLAHIDKIWYSENIVQNNNENPSVYEKLKKWSDMHNGDPITPRYMISSKYVSNKDEAVEILNNLEKQGKGKWINEAKKEFMLVA